jgi:hypothetical protein
MSHICIDVLHCLTLYYVSILIQSTKFEQEKSRIMKHSSKIAIYLALFGFLIYGCSPEHVGKSSGNNNDGPGIAGALDPHPALEVVCSPMDTISLWSEEGSSWCNKCYDMFGVVRPCDAQDSVTSWGNAVLMNGLDSMDTDNDQMYDAAQNIFVANITMAAGWFIRTNQSQFSTNNNWVIQNGIIQIQNDWLSTRLDPVENAWQLRKAVSELPTCFDVALRLKVLSLDLFSDSIAGSTTTVWGRNPNANNPTHRTFSPISPYLTHFCPNNCGTPTVGPTPTDQCVALYVGAPALGSCTNLVAPAPSSPVGTIQYAWSGGQSTASVNVCPTATTTAPAASPTST